MNSLFSPQLEPEACELWLKIATENDSIKSFQADYDMPTDMVTLTIVRTDKSIATSIISREYFEDVHDVVIKALLKR